MAMKAKLFTLGFLGFLGANSAKATLVGTVSVQPVSLSVNASSSSTVNFNTGLSWLVKGTITLGAGETAAAVTFVSGSTTVSGTVNQTANTYSVALPEVSASYSITVTVTDNTGNTYQYQVTSTPVTVTGPTKINVTVPALPTTTTVIFELSGENTQGASFSATENYTLTLTSNTITGVQQVTASVPVASGVGTATIPAGSYAVTHTTNVVSTSLSNFFETVVTQVLDPPTSPVTISGPTFPVAVPSFTLVTLSGNATIGSTNPADTDLSLTQTVSSTTSVSGFALVPASGAYSYPVVNGATAVLEMVTESSSSAQTTVYETPTASTPVSGNTSFSTMFAAEPTTLTTLSGKETAGALKPVSNGTITFSSSNIIGDAGATIFVTTTTNDSGQYSVSLAWANPATGTASGKVGASPDYFANGSSAPAVDRNGTWYLINPDPAVEIVQWGTVGDIPVRGDFDGDGITDIGVFRPSTGQWFIILSSTGAVVVQSWGTSGDIPVPGDFDGDGKTDYAVFRPSTGQWFIILSSNSSVIVQNWGVSTDIPAPADYDGDGKTDFAVFRPSNGIWYIIPSSNPGTPIIEQWGTNGDEPVPGDYDGDGITDIAVWRPSNGTWYIILSSNPGSPVIESWGVSGDIPVPADYDGDQITDIAVWRPSNGTWYVMPSSAPGTSTQTQWGTSGDVPLEKPIGQ